MGELNCTPLGLCLGPPQHTALQKLGAGAAHHHLVPTLRHLLLKGSLGVHWFRYGLYRISNRYGRGGLARRNLCNLLREIKARASPCDSSKQLDPFHSRALLNVITLQGRGRQGGPPSAQGNVS